MTTSADARFAGPLPAQYERHLVPLLFTPYARDLADRAAALAPGAVLELAAGTGIVTRHLAAALPAASVVATDLNPAMVEVGQRLAPHATWRAADAQALPFADGSFDAVLCQFGVMFFPDRAAAYAEARRVLRPGGRFLFSAWDAVAANAFANIVQCAMRDLFPDDPPAFLARTPHGYHDPGLIAQDLARAGFTAAPAVDTVTLQGHAPDAGSAATGFCQGTPLGAEIVARGGDLDRVSAAVAYRLAQRFGYGPIAGPLRAHVISVAA